MIGDAANTTRMRSATGRLAYGDGPLQVLEVIGEFLGRGKRPVARQNVHGFLFSVAPSLHFRGREELAA